MLRNHEAEVKSLKNEFSPHAMQFFNDHRVIAQQCKVEFNGNYEYEVTEALLHKRIDPIAKIHWWYFKEAYMMVYKHKLQPVRGKNFWKIEPHHALKPPTLVKMVGVPKVKIKREKDEAKNRQRVCNLGGLFTIAGLYLVTWASYIERQPSMGAVPHAPRTMDPLILYQIGHIFSIPSSSIPKISD
ncbi:hypothetical protein HAX54_034178 [Datura stramonium]|uniref:Uncharacterized protein n=1 Tax=Datura stramonium TaxID=4076 RepID=A0ABS8SE79_DATST|nr:hypothetical protein [Datura stramonium]